MLWTDSIFITTADLVRVDSEVPRVTDAEGITLTGDNGLLRAVVEEASTELSKLVIAFGGYLNSGDLSANHVAAVLNVGIGNSVRMKVTLSQICVSGNNPGEWNWIKQWAVYWALRILYRNAFSRTVNDRYEKKMNFYKDELVRRVTPSIYGLGVPVVLRPLQAPAAYFERSAGSWGQTNVSLVAGPGTLTASNSCDIAITFVDMSQANLYVSATQPNNAESNPSGVITQVMNTAQVLSVSIASLNPPTGRQDPAQVLVSVMSPMKATHWNVYVGTSGGTLYLQNGSPIPIATKTYTLAGDPVLSGFPVGIGQYQDRRLSIMPTRQRA